MDWRNVIFFTAALSFMTGCKKDDSDDVERIPPRLLSEVAVEDDQDIQEYLQTHCYNYEEFQNPPAGFDFKIRIDTLAGANAGKEPLSSQVMQRKIRVTNDEFLLSTEESVDHTLYYLVVREGEGERPTIADSTFVRYRGSLLDGTVFGGAFNIPDWLDLAAIQGPSQGVRGVTEGVPQFKIGGEVIQNDDGTFTVENYGIGLIVIPSGLAYFNVAQSVIPAYSPLIFEIDLFTLNRTDHDNDGIPSIMEDLNGNGYLYDDNTDLQQERASNTLARFANFLDSDDDQDGTPTRDEIEIDESGNISFPDTDGDGIPDYLDRDNP